MKKQTYTLLWLAAFLVGQSVAVASEDCLAEVTRALKWGADRVEPVEFLANVQRLTSEQLCSWRSAGGRTMLEELLTNVSILPHGGCEMPPEKMAEATALVTHMCREGLLALQISADGRVRRNLISLAIIAACDPEIVITLIKEEAPLTAGECESVSPLYFAVTAHQSSGIVASLIERGASVTAADEWGVTPFHAVITKYIDLIKMEADPLTSESLPDILRSIEILKKAGADLYCKDRHDHSPLDLIENALKELVTDADAKASAVNGLMALREHLSGKTDYSFLAKEEPWTVGAK